MDHLPEEKKVVEEVTVSGGLAVVKTYTLKNITCTFTVIQT